MYSYYLLICYVSVLTTYAIIKRSVFIHGINKKINIEHVIVENYLYSIYVIIEDSLSY